MHVERRQLSGAREWIDDAPRVSGAVVAELRAWAGAEDAAESEHTSVRSENLDSALRASTSALRASKKYHDRRPSRVSAAVLAELRAWAGAEDAAESERKSVRSENLDSALLALRASKKYHTAARSRTPEASGAAHQTGSTWRRAMQRGAERVSQRYNAQVQRHVGEVGTPATCRRDRPVRRELHWKRGSSREEDGSCREGQRQRQQRFSVTVGRWP